MCLEKRVFYRLISGLHSAITISIAANSFKPGCVLYVSVKGGFFALVVICGI